jgi:hypothetical protein
LDAVDTSQAEKIARYLVDAAVWAPSVYDSRPWRFSTRGAAVTVHADTDRRLDVADPDGRQMYISCGAALYTLRLAVSNLGRRPEVRMLTGPETGPETGAGQPGLIAEVRAGAPYATTAEERQMYEQIRRSHTHSGGFRPGGLPIGVLQTLRAQAYAERVLLRIVADPRCRIALAALTECAEQIHRQNPAYVAEVARWAPADGGITADADESSPRETAQTDPDFAGCDFARGQGWVQTGSEHRDATGVVAMLVTEGDDRDAWLSAGQALQRILLCAAEHNVSATFHSQALEVPELREFIRKRFADGGHPQMIIRLGIARPESPHRTVAELTRGEL